MLVAITLLPALLGFAGHRILPRRQRAGAPAAAVAGKRAGLRVPLGALVTRLRVPVLLVGVLGLGALAAARPDMRLALPDAGTAAEGSPAREAYDLISEGFGPGFNGRLVAGRQRRTRRRPPRAAAQRGRRR